jgi:hypothetical protein
MDTSKPIKMEQAIDLFKKGQQVLLVEYRGSVAETIAWRDRDTQKRMEADILRHNVETVAGPIVVNERMGEGFNASTYVSPYKKGQQVLLHFTDMATSKGVTSARGILQPVVSRTPCLPPCLFFGH